MVSMPPDTAQAPLSPGRRRSRIPVPDLLFERPRLALDDAALSELMEISFLGGGAADRLERALAEPEVTGSSWQPELFEDELFLDELVEECFEADAAGQPTPVNKAYLRAILARPPGSLAAIRFRQAVLLELETDDALRDEVDGLSRDLFHLLSLFRAPHKRAKLDITLFRLEILEQAKQIIDGMADRFAAATSGLARLAETGTAAQGSEEYRLMAALLDFENDLARLDFRIRIGADGKIRALELQRLAENESNPFYLTPWKRLKQRFELVRRGFEFSNKELVNRVVHAVFMELSDWIKPLLQLHCQLSFYLGALAFRERAGAAGLEVVKARFPEDGVLHLDGLFNPLLFRQGTPVASRLAASRDDPIVLVTGPNSGGKTRLLQAVGLAQVLGQSGLYVPAREARLPLVDGLMASAAERASVDQREGRLGTELLRIRRVFESVGERSMVLIDELCSGTNPSEAEEIVLMVLRLLRRVRPVGLITTHFLDFARQLEADRPVDGIEFLQVEMVSERSTYQFVPGVAGTSLAAATARRLGVTLEELSGLVAASPRKARSERRSRRR